MKLALNPVSLSVITRGLELGLFEALAGAARSTAAEDEVSVEMTITLGRALGLFAGPEDAPTLTPLSREFLTASSPLRLIGLTRHYGRYLPSAAHVLPAMRRTRRARRTMWRPGEDRDAIKRYFAARQEYNESRRDYFRDTAYLLLRAHARHGLEGRRVICDVGAGPGTFACLLAKSYPRARVSAVDMSYCFDPYLRRSQEEARAEGAALEWLGLNALADPLPRELDLITYNRLLSGVPGDGADAWIRRAYEALAPGGRFAAADFFLTGDAEHDRYVGLVVAQWMAKDRYLIELEPPTDPADDKHQWGWNPPWRLEELARRMMAAGFRDVAWAAADPPFAVIWGTRP